MYLIEFYKTSIIKIGKITAIWWWGRQSLISSLVTVLNVKPYFCIFFFFNKCSFWNLLLQIKSGIFPTVGLKGGNKEEEKGKEGLPLLFALLVCVCVCVCKWSSRCVNVCAYRVQENVWTTILSLSHPFVSVFMHDVLVFFNSELLLEYGQERTPQSTLNTLGVFFFCFVFS